MATYLRFLVHPRLARKTDIWTVMSLGAYLGEIRWWSHWRRYVFAPDDGVIFDAACLTEVTAFISDRMVERRAAPDSTGARE